jgi:hypothetical protein
MSLSSRIETLEQRTAFSLSVQGEGGGKSFESTRDFMFADGSASMVPLQLIAFLHFSASLRHCGQKEFDLPQRRRGAETVSAVADHSHSGALS